MNRWGLRISDQLAGNANTKTNENVVNELTEFSEQILFAIHLVHNCQLDKNVIVIIA